MSRLFSRLNAQTVKDPSRLAYELNKAFDRIEGIVAAIISADSTMPPLAPVTIYADYQGTVSPADQLPREIQATRLYSGGNVTSESTWSVEAQSGAVTASIGASDGLIEITAATGPDNLTVTSDYLGSELAVILTVNFSSATAPQTGSTGGTTASDSQFAMFDTTTHAAVSDELTVTVGSNGQVQLAAPSLRVVGSGEVFGIWRRWNGASWDDVGTEVASNPDAGGGAEGSLTVSPSAVTGLTPSATEKFQLYARRGSGSSNTYLVGTASAVAS